jgi:hypothetical protein
MNTPYYVLASNETNCRALAIHSLVHFIRMENRREASRLWQRFRGRGQRVSREIATEYQLLMRG